MSDITEQAETSEIDHVFAILNQFFGSSPATVMHLGGETGSYPRSFLHRFVQAHLMTPEHPVNPPRFFIIDTEHKFPQRQYQTLLQQLPKGPQRLFVAALPMFTALNQIGSNLHQLLHNAITTGMIRDGDFVVIDSFSEILKTQIADIHSAADYRTILQIMIETLLPALIGTIVDANARLILIHHASFSAATQKVGPYFPEIITSVAGLSVWLSRAEQQTEGGKPRFTADLSLGEKHKCFPFTY